MQLDHLNGRRCRFIALVSVFSARPVECLLLVVHRQDTECYRHIPLYLQLGDTLCHALADEIEMAGFTLNDAAQSDHRIHVRIFGEKLGTESQLESAGDIFDLNIQVAASGAAEGLDRSLEQGFRDFPVPLRYDDAELNIGCRRQGRPTAKGCDAWLTCLDSGVSRYCWIVPISFSAFCASADAGNSF